MQNIKQHIKVLFTMLLAMVLLFSLSGLSIHSHYCSYNKIAIHSLFVPIDECTAEAENQVTENCCKVDVVSCCEHMENTIAKDDCCSNKSEYLKLDVKSIVYNDYSSSQLFVEVVKPLFTMKLYLNPCQDKTSDTYQSFKEPPPISTPEFLSLVQVYTL